MLSGKCVCVRECVCVCVFERELHFNMSRPFSMSEVGRRRRPAAAASKARQGKAYLS